MKPIRDFGSITHFIFLLVFVCFFQSGCGGSNTGGNGSIGGNGMPPTPTSPMGDTLLLKAHFNGSLSAPVATQPYSFRTNLTDSSGKTIADQKFTALVGVDNQGKPVNQDVTVTENLLVTPYPSSTEVWVVGTPETTSKSDAVKGLALGSTEMTDTEKTGALTVTMKTPMDETEKKNPSFTSLAKTVEDVVESPPPSVACQIVGFLLAVLSPAQSSSEASSGTESAFFTFLRNIVMFFNGFFQCPPLSTCENTCSVSEGIPCPAKNMACINNCCEVQEENQVCGDGIVNGKELCDVGQGAKDTCDSGTCNGQICRCCGDHICDTPYGEDHNNCPADCAASTCGNGKLDPGEVCDWAMSSDELLKICPFLGCSNNCDSCCGDGKTTGSEQCDDGSPNFCDSCSDGCCGCTVRLGYTCDNSVQPSECHFTGEGGNTCGNCVCDIAAGENEPGGLHRCPDDCTFCNNNGVCEIELGENVTHCYADCHCGDGNCDDAVENHNTCPQDCLCNPNGICERDAGENCTTCPVDCDVCMNCGDGIKQEYEACDTSLADPPTQGQCPDGKFCDRFCQCTLCGNGVCDGPGEKHLSCGSHCGIDCPGPIDGCDILGDCECWVCGNGTCESVENGYPAPGETVTSCPKDCDVPPPPPPPPPDCSPGSKLCQKIDCALGSVCTLNEAKDGCICVVK